MFLKNPGRRLDKVLKKQEKEEGKRRTKKDETMDCQMWRYLLRLAYQRVLWDAGADPLLSGTEESLCVHSDNTSPEPWECCTDVTRMSSMTYYVSNTTIY